MKVIGLTGGIGSGKTTVANFFKELGVPVYIADEAGKKLLNSSAEVKEKVQKVFGEQAYKNNHPDRKYLADQVFNSKEKLDQLNKIIHPAVREDFENWKKDQSANYVIYEAAILFETGSDEKCDAVIVVTAPYSERLKRLQKRDQSSIEEIEARKQHQWNDDKKRALANFEIENIDLHTTKDSVKNLHEILLKYSKN